MAWTPVEFREAVERVRSRRVTADEDSVSDELETSDLAAMREAAAQAEAAGLVRIIRSPGYDDVYEPSDVEH